MWWHTKELEWNMILSGAKTFTIEAQGKYLQLVLMKAHEALADIFLMHLI